MADESATLTADEIRAQAAEESERITMIRSVCDGRFGEIEATAIREGWDRNRVELEVLRASRPKAPAIHSSPVFADEDVI